MSKGNKGCLPCDTLVESLINRKSEIGYGTAGLADKVVMSRCLCFKPIIRIAKIYAVNQALLDEDG